MEQEIVKDLEEIQEIFDELAVKVADMCDKYKKLVEDAKK